MKKVLSLVLAAAMTMGIAATSFAMTEDQKDTNATMMAVINDNKAVGTTVISTLTADDGSSYTAEIKAGDSADYRFSAVAVVNTSYQGKAIDYNYHNLEATVRVKGPATASKETLHKETFCWWTVGDKTYLYVEGTFRLTADNKDATKMKGLVVEYGVKPVLAPTRSGLKGATVKNTTQSIEAGYTNEDVDRIYDDVVTGYDDMITYEENSFEVALENNPVIPSSAIRFLQKNLANNKSVIFVLKNENDSTYFNGAVTVELNGSNIKKLSSTNHANIQISRSMPSDLSDDALADADFEYKWFSFVTPRENIEGTFSLETDWAWDNANVYLIDADGALTNVTKNDTEDYPYGDVVFSGPMTRYLITEGNQDEYLLSGDDTTDEPIEDDDLIDEPTEDDDNLVDEDGNPIENNPGTGSSNAISLAVAMAVVSLAAAGLVASKKASK